MEDFTIKMHLTKKEYAKVMFVGLYKKPVFILATLFGLYLMTTAILDYSGTPLYEIICGAFLLLAPTLIVLIAINQFASNLSFQNDMTYTFSENGVAIQGMTFKSEFLWSHIIKQKELGKFLILYHTKKFGNFIDKTKLTTNQLGFIKSKIKRK
jgi:hypothetical protein